MKQELTIGKLAKEAEVGIETVRFYERKGLIRKPAKEPGGFRYYPRDDAQRIRFVKRAQELGFTLREIKELLDLNSNPRTTCGDVCQRTEHKIEEVEAKIRDLQRMKRSLKELVVACGNGKQAMARCRVMNAFESGGCC